MPLLTPSQADGQSTSAVYAGPTVPARDPHTPQQPTGQAPQPRLRRHRRNLIVAGILTAGAVATLAVALGGGDEVEDPASTATPIQAVEAVTGDLVEHLTLDGTLTYEDPTIVSAAADGTVTEITEVDDVLERGDLAYSLDASPVVVMWGDFPLYRSLAAGIDDGADVAVLEANLAALGHNANGALVIDETFDDATTIAIEEFQSSVGLSVDGIIDPASVLLLPGPAIVNDVEASAGAVLRAGAPVLSVQVTDAVTPITLPAATAATNGDEDTAEPRQITMVPNVGAALATGDVAYEIETDPVITIVGDTPIDRSLSLASSDGPDIATLEQALVDQGYDAGGEVEVDETFDAATEEALMAWEDDLGLSGDGIATPHEFVVLPTNSVVTSIDIERGDRIVPGDIVFTVGVSTRTLTATVDIDDEDLITVGDSVEVDVGDQTLTGTIIEMIDVAANPADSASVDTLRIEIVLDETVDPGPEPSIAVDVRIVETLASDATLVPASALVSVGDGTYAVEVVSGNDTSFVAVEPGAFADGMVQVDGIEAGTAVVVPS